MSDETSASAISTGDTIVEEGTISGGGTTAPPPPVESDLHEDLKPDPSEESAAEVTEDSSVSQPNPGPAAAPGAGPTNEPAGTHYGATSTRPISDPAWESAVRDWMQNHVHGSPIARATDAWNHLGSVLGNLRELLEKEMKGRGA